MSGWALFVEGFCAGVALMAALVWFVSAIVRIELAEQERRNGS